MSSLASMGSNKPTTSWIAHLPPELWVDVLSFLPHADLGKALCSCRALAGIGKDAWKAACFRRWPAWSLMAEEPDAPWRRVYELLTLREGEQAFITDLELVKKTQSIIRDRHRGILAEWMCEVSFEWDLDSSVVFDAVRYLDHYLSAKEVDHIGRFQLLGLACLRSAMVDAQRPVCQSVPLEKLLAPERFAYISAGACTPEQVEKQSKLVSSLVPENLKQAPNAKMFLRSFWFRTTSRGVASSDEMHIYTFAAFLLQMGLLELPCSAFPHSMLAASALSLSLVFFGKDTWSSDLSSFGSYSLEDLQPCRQRLAAALASQEARNLRTLWYAHCKTHDYATYTEEWRRLLDVVAQPTDAVVTLLLTSGLEQVVPCRVPVRQVQSNEDQFWQLLGRFILLVFLWASYVVRKKVFSLSYPTSHIPRELVQIFSLHSRERG